MSGLASSFLFAGNFPHLISCITGNSSTIVTGSLTGEIVYWKKHKNYIPSVFCSIPSNTPCIQLIIIPGSKELSILCEIPWVIVSLHEKSKLRVWDLNDGKCLSYSGDMFPETSSLKFIAKSNDDYIIVSGSNKAYMIDVFKMQNLKYFCTEKKILGISCYKNKFYAQCIDKIYIFDTNSQDNSSWIVLENWVNIKEKVFIDSYENLIIIGNSHDLQIVLKDHKEQFSIQKLQLPSVIKYLVLTEIHCILSLEIMIMIYKQSDIVNYHKSKKYLLSPDIIKTDFDSVCYGFIDNILVITDGMDLRTFDIGDKSFKAHKWMLDNQNFSFLSNHEKITVYNICLAEDILLGIGTDTGKTILLTLTYSMVSIFFHTKSKVLSFYLHNNTLAVAYKNETLAFWAYKPCLGTNKYTQPIRIIEIWSGSIKNMMPINNLKRKINCFNEMSWVTAKTKWKNMILGQCKTGVIMLICFKKLSINFYFQALKSNITKAIVLLNIDYLAICYTNGHIYLFNMAMLAFEREVVGEALGIFDIECDVNDKICKSLDKNDRFTACYEFYYMEPIKKPIEVKYVSLGNARFPVLQCDIGKIKHDSKIVGQIKNFITSKVMRKGIYGKEQCFAFINDWATSSHLNALSLANMIDLNIPLEKMLFSSFSLIVLALVPNSNFRSKFLDFIDLSPSALEIYKDMLKSHNDLSGNIKKPLKQANNIISENGFTDKYHSKRIFLSIPNAISITALVCASIKELFPRSKSIIDNLIIMIKSSDEGYILLASELLSCGISILSDCFIETQIEELIKELLLHSCKGYIVPKNYFYEILTTLGLIYVNIFIKTLTSEIKNNEIHEKYQQQILNTIEFFTIHHVLEATSVLEELGEFILKSNEIKNNTENQVFIQDFNSVLQTLAGILPMVALSSDLRILVFGLATGFLQVYDLKTSKRWKNIKVFETTISALDMKENYIACYSSQESCLKTVKIEQKLLGSITGNGELKLMEKMQLGEIEPLANSYHELIRITRLRWVDMKSVSIVREDKREYQYSVKKFN
ncbi:hypothetical protein SteCoe_31913 [Stentor coeruleus]|uniref:Uncharacterized protein n=1 Tax=Stentor coeruleus TaxID=5963 RepID=A0A1R2B094_9CILI|nr:hypothetical protein SteCoe_31913 [Stentor coeruleus]